MRLNASNRMGSHQEPIFFHDHRMRRNHLKGRDGDRINAVLAAAPLTSMTNSSLCMCAPIRNAQSHYSEREMVPRLRVLRRSPRGNMRFNPRHVAQFTAHHVI